MSYPLIYRDFPDGVFVPLWQTGYSSTQVHGIAAARSSGPPLNYTHT